MVPVTSARPPGPSSRRAWACAALAAVAALLLALGGYLPGGGSSYARLALLAIAAVAVAAVARAAIGAAQQAHTNALEAQRLHADNARQLQAATHARDQVRSVEARLRTGLDSALDAGIAMDARGTVTAWNPRAEEIFGWTRDEAVGRRLAELIIPPGQREEHARGLDRFLAGGDAPLLGRRV